jgi:hypothetical protein
MRSKTGEAGASAFRTTLAKTGGRRPMAVRTDKGKEFVNSPFRKLLDAEGVEMTPCKNPDVK